MSYALQNKSNVRDAGAQIKGDLRPGDLLHRRPARAAAARPLLPARALPVGHHHGAREGPEDHGLARLGGPPDAARTATALEPLLARVPVGGHVLLVRPVTYGTKNWRPRWTTLVRRRSAQWGQALSHDRRFRLTTIAPTFYKHASVVGDALLLYTRVPGS